MNQREKIERIKEFRLIDDVFFEVFASDIPACQEILRIILEDEKLIVNDVTVQSSERNLYIVDGQVVVEKGKLLRKEQYIKKIDCHRRIANILDIFMGDDKLIKIGLEVPKQLNTVEYQKIKERDEIVGYL